MEGGEDQAVMNRWKRLFSLSRKQEDGGGGGGRPSSLCPTEEGSSCDTHSSSSRGSRPSIISKRPSPRRSKNSQDAYQLELHIPAFEWSWNWDTLPLDEIAPFFPASLTSDSISGLATRVPDDGGLLPALPNDMLEDLSAVEAWLYEEMMACSPPNIIVTTPSPSPSARLPHLVLIRSQPRSNPHPRPSKAQHKIPRKPPPAYPLPS